jgi:hypothetical protein
MMNTSVDAQILSQEKWAIELLARETHTAIAKVQEAFLLEYKKLAANARVKSYLPLLVRKSVRIILDAKNAPPRFPATLQPDPEAVEHIPF